MSAVTRETVRGKGRVYSNSTTGEQFPSVTTILGVLDKPALPRWASKMVATYVADNGLEPLQNLTREEGIRHLSGVPWKRRDSAADVGTAVHTAAEAMLKGESPEFTLPFSDEARNAMANVKGLLEHLGSSFEIVVQEGTVWNRTYGFAGAFDGIALLDKEPVLFDWKTSSGAYREMSLQLTAYRNGEHIVNIETGEEFPMPEVSRCLIFHVPKAGGWSIHESDAGPEEFACFLAAQGAYRWFKSDSGKLTCTAKGNGK